MADADKVFTAPPFLSDQSADEIHQRMLADLPDDIDTSEGGFAWDFTRPTALEKAEMVEFEIEEAIKLMFPQYAYDAWLDLHAGMRGISRKAATAATGTVTVTGTVGTIISTGFLFSTEAGTDDSGQQFQTTEIATIGAGGTVDVPIQAVATGVDGNVLASTITLMVKPMSGIQSATNAAATSGGTDAEDDESLRARIIAYDASQGASFVGNAADYKRWALEVNGIGSAIIVPPAEADGTVTIVVTDSTGAPASSDLVQAVYDHIMRPDSPLDRLAPINALINVMPPVSVPISITATVVLDGTQTIDAVNAAFVAALLAYYPSSITQGTVKYAEVGALLIGTSGVSDYSDLQVNGATANIPITSEESPTTESVVLSELDTPRSFWTRFSPARRGKPFSGLYLRFTATPTSAFGYSRLSASSSTTCASG